mmetsp:Transcript_33822/g.69135  ORF Transcript_33822/g.69135 Transcript_33822/m.69135 type:complete len:389 (+) Transcript_33822:43-1209(+)
MTATRRVNASPKEISVEEENVVLTDAPTKGRSAAEVNEAEGKVLKILVRTVSGGLFVLFFNFVIYAGHLYTALFIALLQWGCFREMIRVGLDPAFEKKLPGFLALQWAWFACAAFGVYSSWLEALHADPATDTSRLPVFVAWLLTPGYSGLACLALFSVVFVASVLVLRPPQACYLYQMRRLSFSMVALMMIFGQMRGTPAALYKGLIWYFVPSSIVATNDIMAYFTGVAVGRRFVDKPLLQLSPNKTWEGYCGAVLWTAGFAFLFTGRVAGFKWMTCPAEALTWQVHAKIDCEPHAMFRHLPAASLPSWWPADEVPVRPVQLHMMAVAVFASTVGPFGGFLASAIKRAYDIKDFAAFLPGHGGLMDRNDCQMLTALFVVVYMGALGL